MLHLSCQHCQHNASVQKCCVIAYNSNTCYTRTCQLTYRLIAAHASCGAQHCTCRSLILILCLILSGSQLYHRQDLDHCKLEIQELFGKINEIRRKAEQSEVMVQEICRDIKKLDYAKKHLTYTITALRRMAMLINAIGTSMPFTATAKCAHMQEGQQMRLCITCQAIICSGEHGLRSKLSSSLPYPLHPMSIVELCSIVS